MKKLKFIIFPILLFNLLNYSLDCFSQETETLDNNTEEKTENKDKLENALSKIETLLKGKKDILPSIMFKDEQIKKIDRALKSEEGEELFDTEIIDNENQEDIDTEQQKYQEREISNVHMGSILYFSPNNWSIWLSGKKISSINNSPENEFYIRSINSNKVDILWTVSLSKWKILSGKQSETEAPRINQNNQVEILFSLQPNQTYILENHQVIEGKIKSNYNKPQ